MKKKDLKSDLKILKNELENYQNEQSNINVELLNIQSKSTQLEIQLAELDNLSNEISYYMECKKNKKIFGIILTLVPLVASILGCFIARGITDTFTIKNFIIMCSLITVGATPITSLVGFSEYFKINRFLKDNNLEEVNAKIEKTKNEKEINDQQLISLYIKQEEINSNIQKALSETIDQVASISVIESTTTKNKEQIKDKKQSYQKVKSDRHK